MAAEASIPLFILLRSASGVASAFVLVLVSALVLDRLTAADRTCLRAPHFAGVGIGIAGSAMLVAPSPAGGLGWRRPWLDRETAASGKRGTVRVNLGVPRTNKTKN